MGKGDQRSRRGKIWRGTFGKRRPKKSKSGPKPAVAVDNTSPKQEKQKQSRASSKGQEAE